jgi:hypothetical protein
MRSESSRPRIVAGMALDSIEGFLESFCEHLEGEPPGP